MNSANSLVGSDACFGGGVLISHLPMITLETSTIQRNGAYGPKSAGGGIYVSGSNAVALHQSKIKENVAKHGGGMQIVNATLSNTESVFDGNIAYEMGSLDTTETALAATETVSDAKYGLGGN